MKKDDIRSEFVLGKSRLSPTKENILTIPKLEAVVIAARMKTKMVEEIDLGINQLFLWSDSKATINFIKNQHARSNVYILHRTNEIRNLTKSTDWRHIPGELNVSDFATKYTEFSKLTSTCCWYNSPNFLYEINYLDLLDLKDYKETHEPKTQINSIEQKVEQPLTTNNLPLIFNYSKCSSFQKLIRHIAWIIKLKSNRTKSCRDETDRGNLRYLSKPDLNHSKITILIIAQKQSYHEENSVLSKNKICHQQAQLFISTQF